MRVCGWEWEGGRGRAEFHGGGFVVCRIWGHLLGPLCSEQQRVNINIIIRFLHRTRFRIRICFYVRGNTGVVFILALILVLSTSRTMMTAWSHAYASLVGTSETGPDRDSENAYRHASSVFGGILIGTRGTRVRRGLLLLEGSSTLQNIRAFHTRSLFHTRTLFPHSHSPALILPCAQKPSHYLRRVPSFPSSCPGPSLFLGARYPPPS